jgi:hypothetical protein
MIDLLALCLLLSTSGCGTSMRGEYWAPHWPSFTEDPRPPSQQKEQPPHSEPISLKHLGWSPSWALALKRYRGYHAYYRFRILAPGHTGKLTLTDGVLGLTWNGDSVRTDSIREESCAESVSQHYEADEYMFLRGEHVNVDSVVGGGVPDGLVLCLGEPPSLAITLMGQVSPRFRENAGVVPRDTPGTSQTLVFSGPEGELSVGVPDAALPLPAQWTIKTRKGEESIFLLNPVVDSATGRLVPSVVLQYMMRGSQRVQVGLWVLIGSPVADETVPMRVEVGTPVLDLRLNRNSRSQVVDRMLELRELPSWLGIVRAPSPTGEVRTGIGASPPEVQLATSVHPEADASDALVGQQAPHAAPSVLSPTALSALDAIGILPTEDRALNESTEFTAPGLPTVSGRCAFVIGSTTYAFRDIHEPMAGMTARAPAPPATASTLDAPVGHNWTDALHKHGGSVEDRIVRVEQVGTELRAIGVVRIRATLPEDCGKRLTSVVSGCGVKTLCELPMVLGAEYSDLALEVDLSRPWPTLGRLAVTLNFDDGTALSLPFDPGTRAPAITLAPPRIRTQYGQRATLNAYSESYKIVNWTWTRIPECVTAEVGADSHSPWAWTIAETPKANMRHKCGSLGADVLVTKDVPGGKPDSTHITILIAVDHDACVTDDQGRRVQGGIFMGGERIAIARSPTGVQELIFPDRLPCMCEDIGRQGWTILDTMSIPRGQADAIVEWIPKGCDGIHVCGLMCPGIAVCNELWALGCR